MNRVAVVGAGGRIGLRITDKLRASGYDVYPVEVSSAGIERVRSIGLEVSSEADAFAAADTVILAVPDNILGKVAASVEAKLQSDTLVVILDAAVPYADALPTKRTDLRYFVCHPCHPPIFSDLDTSEQRLDHFGGIAPQGVVCALVRGSDDDYAKGEALARIMFAPVSQTHRITLEQMALLEPGLAEIVTLTLVDAVCTALEVCVERGVPREAATDFLLGHLNIEFAMWLGKAPKAPSDAAIELMNWARGRIFRDDWLKVLDNGTIKQTSRMIAGVQADAAVGA